MSYADHHSLSRGGGGWKMTGGNAASTPQSGRSGSFGQPSSEGRSSFGENYDDDDDEGELEDDEEEELEDEEGEDDEEEDDGDGEETDEEDEKREDDWDSNRPRSLAFAYLQGQLLYQRDLSQQGQNILKGLLDNADVELNETPAAIRTAMTYVSNQSSRKRTISSSLSDTQVFEHAKAGDLSFLGSILAVFEEEMGDDESTPISARQLIKRCCLAVPPGKLPGLLDTEEMTMAALEFLSSSFAPSSGAELPNLPLIQPVKEENDIKKRSFIKAQKWKLIDLMDQVLALDDIFLNDANSFKWLRRDAFAPVHLTFRPSETGENHLGEEFQLLLKGKHEVVTTAKKRGGGGAGGPSKKAARNQANNAATASQAMHVIHPRSENSTPTGSAATPNSLVMMQAYHDPVAQEATRIMNETNSPGRLFS